MKKLIPWIVATVVLAIIFHFITIMAVPSGIMSLLAYRTEKHRKANTIYHAPPVTEESRRVVRPSPDLIYSAILYDVSDNSLRIKAPVPDTYWSLSAFASNTDNFYVINDTQLKSKNIEIILAGKGKKPLNKENTIVVESPSEKGFVVLRMLIKDEARIGELIKVQKQATCEVVKNIN